MPDSFGGRVQLRQQCGVAALSYGLTNDRHPMRNSAIAAARDARRAAYAATTPLECVEIFNAVQACEKIPGDMAEAGVYRGGTAAVMLAASKAKRLHLFDTFEGLPNAEGGFAAGEYRGSVDEVRANLSPWADRIDTHKGLLPHDYPLVEGVVRAFHEFFDSRPEPFVPLSGNQCIAVKI